MLKRTARKTGVDGKKAKTNTLDSSEPHEAAPSSNTETEQKASTKFDKLIYLTDGIFCNKDRTQLFELREDDDDGKSFKPVKTRWGMPVLEKVYQDDARGDDRVDNHTYYEIRLSGRPHQGTKRFTHYQIEFGKWAAAFSGVAVAKQSQQKLYANVIFEQQDAFGIPLEIMPEHTGIQRDECTGTYHYVLRNGKHLHQDGAITDGHAPMARYSFDAEAHSNHLAAWEHYEQALPEATSETVLELLEWVVRTDPSGNLLLLLMFAYRSLACTIVPVETAVIAAAQDGTTIMDGGSGSGKTSSVDFARGADGPTPYKAEQDAAFSGSLTGIEARIDPLRDVLVSISDFHFNAEKPAEREIRAMAEKFDAFIRSVSDNGEVKSRGTRGVTVAQGTRIKAGLVFDGEMLPPLFLSRLRRAIVLQFKRGVLNANQLHSGWWTYQGKHTAIGRALISWILASINTNRSEFVHLIKEAEAAAMAQMFNTLVAERPNTDKAIARSLANNYARCLCPLTMIEGALGECCDELRELVQNAAARSMIAFADMLDNGGPSQISAEWVINAINQIFESREGHLLTMGNFPLKGEENDLLSRWGYERTGLVETPWAPGRNGIHIANISDDLEVVWFRPIPLMNTVKKRAEKEFGAFPYTPQTFPALLVRLGVAEKASQRNTWVEKFNGIDDRRLRVSVGKLDSHSIEIENQSGSSGSSGSGSQWNESTGQSTELPLPATAPNGENIAVADNDNLQDGSTGHSIKSSATAVSEADRAVAESGSYTDGSIGQFSEIATAATSATASKQPVHIRNMTQVGGGHDGSTEIEYEHINLDDD